MQNTMLVANAFGTMKHTAHNVSCHLFVSLASDLQALSMVIFAALATRASVNAHDASAREEMIVQLLDGSTETISVLKNPDAAMASQYVHTRRSI